MNNANSNRKYSIFRSSKISRITPKNNEPIDRTIKRFIRKVKKSGIAEEFRKRQYYEKPSMKKRKEKLRREATIKKLQEEEGK